MDLEIKFAKLKKLTKRRTSKEWIAVSVTAPCSAGIIRIHLDLSPQKLTFNLKQ